MHLGIFRFTGRALSVALALLAATALQAQQGQGGRGGNQGGGGFVGGGGGGFGGGGNQGANRSYQNTTMVGDAMITSDVDTRRLIVVTDDATNDNIKQIVASLDKPKPQVLINVVFVQVTHDNNFDLGAEAVYKGPISIKTNPDGIATTRFGVGDQLKDNTVYGAFYQLMGRDVTATIHALSNVGKTEILSRPSILTRSNQQATILVGQNVPLFNGTTQNANTTSTNVSYQDVGIILRVTPFITQEGMVEMIVSPEISAISATTVNIPGFGAGTVIDKRQADTVVVTPSDQTIVIGGLISSQKNDTTDKVPILGDIPLLGAAFRRKTTGDTKTELLIFLTPHVVMDPKDLNTVTQGEQGKLNMTPTAFEKADIGRFVPGLAQEKR